MMAARPEFFNGAAVLGGDERNEAAVRAVSAAVLRLPRLFIAGIAVPGVSV